MANPSPSDQRGAIYLDMHAGVRRARHRDLILRESKRIRGPARYQRSRLVRFTRRSKKRDLGRVPGRREPSAPTIDRYEVTAMNRLERFSPYDVGEYLRH